MAGGSALTHPWGQGPRLVAYAQVTRHLAAFLTKTKLLFFERVDHECTYLQSRQKCTTPARQGSGTMVDCFVDMNRNISNISTSSTTSITNGVGGSTYTYVMLI